MENGVFASNISSSIDDKTLRTFFNQFGTVSDFNLQPDKFNESAKICYLKYSTNDGAAKAVKMADKSTEFGDALRVSFKKFLERNPNGKPTAVNRVQSFGRGRGASQTSPILPSFAKENVQLKYLNLTLERKFAVEIVELTNLINILARPLLLTDKLRANLFGLLEKINEDSDKLIAVKNPEVNNFYLAKWSVDNKFYRSKIIQKLSDNKFEVCFVDEGTSGDIVTELRIIPEELCEIPCQFLQCTLDCENSKDLIELVMKEGSDSTVFIYGTNEIKIEDKYVINIFINDKDIIDIYKSKYPKDPRRNKLLNKKDIKSHSLEQEYLQCQLIKDKETNYIFGVLKECSFDVDSSKLKPLYFSPLSNDLLVYRENTETYLRCFVESYKFIKCQAIYTIFLVDQNKSLETDREHLMIYTGSELTSPSKMIKGVFDSPNKDSSLYEGLKTIKLSDYDSKKNLYVIKVIQKEMINQCKITSSELVGQMKTVLLSHIESVNEFYVQFLDNNSLSSLTKVQDEINSENYQIVKINQPRDLQLKEVVVAPFQGVNYRAMVQEIDITKNRVLLYFIDFGNSEWTLLTEVMKANKGITLMAPLARRCRLAATVNEEKLNEITALLLDYCEQGESEVHMKIKDMKEDILIVNLTVKNKSTFEDILEFKKLVSQKEVNIKELLVKTIADLERRISILEKTFR